MKHCLIIGGGAAGLMAAINFGRNIESENYKITIIERMDNVGFKLLATGNGRCNLTNVLPVDEFINYGFGRDKFRFMKSAMYELPPPKLREFFHINNLETVITDNFHIFPASQKSADVLNVFKNLIRTNPHISTINNAKVENFLVNDSRISGVIIDGKKLYADCVIISCGGMSYPQTGSNGSIFPLLQTIGHKVVDMVPALVGLQVIDKQFTTLAGNVLKNSEVSLKHSNFKKFLPDTGELLFTQTGVSGPAILDISGKVNRLIHNGEKIVHLAINLNRDYDADFWKSLLQKTRATNGKRLVRSLLHEFFFQALVDVILNLSTISHNKKVAELNSQELASLIQNLSALDVAINNNDGFKKAIATSGGVDLTQVHGKTLASTIFSNLFFAGESLDIDGRCGGYNLTWAFASGSYAGLNAAKSIF